MVYWFWFFLFRFFELEFFIILCIYILFLTLGGDCWLDRLFIRGLVFAWWMLYLLPLEAVLPGFEFMLPTLLFEF